MYIHIHIYKRWRVCGSFFVVVVAWLSVSMCVVSAVSPLCFVSLSVI